MPEGRDSQSQIRSKAWFRSRDCSKNAVFRQSQAPQQCGAFGLYTVAYGGQRQLEGNHGDQHDSEDPPGSRFAEGFAPTGSALLHPLLFFVYGIFIAHIFTYLIFSLVFTFGNIGKAIAIIFLVLQIPAGGGTFPAEMTPEFFRAIHPFLPFTYAISCMREITAGIYRPTLLYDTLTLLCIPLLSILMVLIVGPRLRRHLLIFERNLKRSGLE